MPDTMNATRLLEDLNGNRTPHGIAYYFLDLLRVLNYHLNFKPWRDDYVRLLRSYVDMWLATGRSEGDRYGPDTPSARHPTEAISRIVVDVVLTNRVLPAALKDGYRLFVESKAWHEEFTEVAVADAIARKVFVDMLVSDFRLKIAQCVDPACGMYFRLGKWDHRYAQGTRCTGCRQMLEQGAKQKLVEANRLRGKQKLYDFVARRFARRIMPGRLWYRDRALKAEIAAAVNQRFQNDALFATLYPKAITGKWVESGQKGRKNWLLIEQAQQSLR